MYRSPVKPLKAVPPTKGILFLLVAEQIVETSCSSPPVQNSKHTVSSLPGFIFFYTFL